MRRLRVSPSVSPATAIRTGGRFTGGYRAMALPSRWSMSPSGSRSTHGPADGGTDQDPSHEFTREPEPARVSRCVGSRSTAVFFRRFTRPSVAKLIAETPEPRGESSLVGLAFGRIVAVVRVIGHVDATRAPLPIRFLAPSRPRGPYLLDGV